MDLTDQLRAFTARYRSLGAPESARTNRTNPPAVGVDAISAICTRGSGSIQTSEPNAHPPALTPAARWDEDAHFIYIERLAAADDLGLDTAVGSAAEQIALREARRVDARLPAAWSVSREPTVADAMLAAFEPMGGLRYAGVEEGAP